jgi:translation initiation factor IF-3
MRISRRSKKEQPQKINYRFNEGIETPRILVLDNAGANLGIMTTAQAIRLARDQEMDLVEINPKTDPPVAKIIDFGQFRYQKEKELRLKKAHQHVVEIKGVRLSLRIGKHDLEIRKTQAIKFLNNGDKIKVEIMLRGREMQQAKTAFDIIKQFFTELNTIEKIRWEQEIEKQGNKVTAIMAKS